MTNEISRITMPVYEFVPETATHIAMLRNTGATKTIGIVTKRP